MSTCKEIFNNVHQMDSGKLQEVTGRNKLVKSLFVGCNVVDEANPVRKAYFLYEPKGRRYSWDLTAVEYAIAGENGHYALSEPGMIQVQDDGSNSFLVTPEGTHRYLLLTSEPEEHVAFFDRLLTT